MIKLPVSPAREFKKINTAAVAAAVFTSAHFFNSKTGDKKIPPPTPIIPLKNPIPPPQTKACLLVGLVILATTLF